MKAIFASKFYKDSSRKDSIQAALADPGNKALMKQLRSYLDDDTLEELSKNEVSDDVDVENVEVEKDEDEKIRPSEYTESRVANHSSPRSTSGSGFDDVEFEDTEPADTKSEDNSESSSVEESQSIINKTQVTGSESIEQQVSKELDSIKGLLDSREDTAGVARIVETEDELWIHYKDAINLNNVMEPVIALVANAGYTYLQFNRLARTENAIVFSIQETSTITDSEDDSE